MNDSHEVITLELMAQCLSDANELFRNGVMSFGDYADIHREAAGLIRGVLSFAQDNGLEIKDGEETEAWEIADNYVNNIFPMRDVIQEDRLDPFIDREGLSGTLVVEPGSGAVGKPQWLVYSYDLTSFVRQQVNVLESHNWDVA